MNPSTYLLILALFAGVWSILLEARDVADAAGLPESHACIGRGHSASILWEDDFSGSWETRWPLKFVGNYKRAFKIDHDGDTWLRVVYPKWQTRKGLGFATKLGPRNSMYMEYDLRFGDDFDWVKGGKLPGLYGGARNTGSRVPDGTDGWTVRFMWHRDGKGSAYVYHPDQSRRFGDHFRLSDFWFKKGVVQKLGLEVVMNTPGLSDGVVCAWLDDGLVVKETNLRFRDISTLQIDGFYFSTFFGGKGQDWAPTKDEYIDFGNFKLYTSRP